MIGLPTYTNSFIGLLRYVPTFYQKKKYIYIYREREREREKERGVTEHPCNRYLKKKYVTSQFTNTFFHLPNKFVARQFNLAINGRPKITNKLLAIEGWKENSSRRKSLVHK